MGDLVFTTKELNLTADEVEAIESCLKFSNKHFPGFYQLHRQVTILDSDYLKIDTILRMVEEVILYVDNTFILADSTTSIRNYKDTTREVRDLSDQIDEIISVRNKLRVRLYLFGEES